MNDPRALVELPDIVRGDTFYPRSHRFTDTESGELLAIASVRMNFLTVTGDVIHNWTPEMVTLGEDGFWRFDKVQNTSDWPIGRVVWDVELTYENGDIQSVMYGQFRIRADYANG